MMRVKNEARWIEQSVKSLFPMCEQVIMLNDHSTDGTDTICRAIPCVTMYDSPFSGLNEVRDKNWLLDKVLATNPDWVIGIDGDEQLQVGGQKRIRELIAENDAPAFSFRVVYLWNDAKTIRTDGVYSTMHRPSMWKNTKPDHFQSIHGGKAGFHCSNVPIGSISPSKRVDVTLLHYGYMHLEDRLRKFAFYNQNDPNNSREDGYRHIIQGDPGGAPASATLKHAGPLRLEKLCKQAS